MAMEETQAAWSSLVLLERFLGGDDRAAEELFSRYFERLTSLARSRLSPRLASRTDPEDVVMSVYRSFFIEARAGRFALRRGGDLWRLLASITKHKLLRQARHHTADRRSVDLELPLRQAEVGGTTGRGREPSAEDAAALADELEWVFSRLNVFGRRVLELRLQGAQLSEIAEETGRSDRTIRRTLGQIRGLLAGRMDDDGR
jgi:RNA polymerase sigma factor (sigma-70 family)